MAKKDKKNLDDVKKKAEIPREQKHSYRGAKPGVPLDEVQGNPEFKTEQHFTGVEDENTIDEELVQSGVDTAADDDEEAREERQSTPSQGKFG